MHKADGKQGVIGVSGGMPPFQKVGLNLQRVWAATKPVFIRMIYFLLLSSRRENHSAPPPIVPYIISLIPRLKTKKTAQIACSISRGEGGSGDLTGGSAPSLCKILQVIRAG